MGTESSTEVRLADTSYGKAWEEFVGVMIALWCLVLLVSVFLLVLCWKTKARLHQRASTSQLLVIETVLHLNWLNAVLRILFFVDPRGWNDIYPSIVYELLLRIVTCSMLAQWLFIILRWWELGDFGSDKSFRSLVEGARNPWHIVGGAVGVCTALVVIFTCVDEARESKTLKQPINAILAIYTGLFTFAGIFAGIRGVLTLIQLAKRRRALTGESASVVTVHERKSFQITVSVAMATPMTLTIVAISVWRGNSSLSAKAFFAYLATRNVIELLLCSLLFYAIQRDPSLLAGSVTRMAVNARTSMAHKSVAPYIQHALRNSGEASGSGGTDVHKAKDTPAQTTVVTTTKTTATNDNSNSQNVEAPPPNRSDSASSRTGSLRALGSVITRAFSRDHSNGSQANMIRLHTNNDRQLSHDDSTVMNRAQDVVDGLQAHITQPLDIEDGDITRASVGTFFERSSTNGPTDQSLELPTLSKAIPEN